MATLVNLGFSGVNLDHILYWEDNPQGQELAITFAVPWMVTQHAGVQYVTQIYREQARTRLLFLLESPGLNA
jgi:hypothetical protein